MWIPGRIVSGGQTGADRAALDAARDLGIPAGGWVPEGRLAEDGVIDARYTGLVEAPSSDPAVRTRLNVRDSDATLVVAHGPVAGGTALTIELARETGRPLLHLDLDALGADEAARALSDWLDARRPAVLNVAGPRASEDPRVGAATHRLLRLALRPAAARPGSGRR